MTVQATGAEAILKLIQEQKAKLEEERAKRHLDPEYKLRKKDLPADNTSTITKQASKLVRGLGHTDVTAFIDEVAPPSSSTFVESAIKAFCGLETDLTAAQIQRLKELWKVQIAVDNQALAIDAIERITQAKEEEIAIMRRSVENLEKMFHIFEEEGVQGIEK
ncbi:hypothetical protein QFC24_002145 [Naganishia onofrii]|uniref:Uncharacterized protein n=1 Tax=Naganishia onofrii TaxID=1851511 RepID=A0ACC2XSN8_9TREE|nr:hypothetical protein QFC24_002145 [Naganishia onofrii]